MKKLSEILIGIPEEEEKNHIQGFLHLKSSITDEDQYCALGKIMCLEGFGDQILGQRIDGHISFIVFERLGVKIGSERIKCPYKFPATHDEKFTECHCKDSLSYIIIHLNDNHNLTYKQIGECLLQLGY